MRFLLVIAVSIFASDAWAAARFALVLGSNKGHANRPTLWFAERDADRLAGTLRELGDFEQDHVRVLHAANRQELETAFAEMNARILEVKRTGQRSTLVFYFSGHASAGALELGNESFDFSALRSQIERSEADVKVAIVDACESGQLTQVKGARPSAELDFALPQAEATVGIAYIASTAAGEVAQESAALGGSFFTFHLETALRGAGDANLDGQVSLAEAFQYTASRTTTGTSTTTAGPQHPTYNFRMSGRGDVILSDLRRADARLTLPGDATNLYVISKDGALVAESPGGLSLALPQGLYRVERRVGTNSWGGPVELHKGEAKTLPELAPLTLAQVRGKGATATWGISAGAVVAAPLLASTSISPGARLGLQWNSSKWGLGFGVSYLTAYSAVGSPVQFRTHELEWDVSLLFRLWSGPLEIDAGPRVGGSWHLQSLESDKTSLQASSGFGAALIRVSTTFDFLWVGFEVVAGGKVVPVDRVLSARVHGQAILFVGALL